METIQNVAQPHSERTNLLRILGLGFGLAVVVGGTIGASIFRLPGSVAALLATPWLIILAWVLGGLYTLLGANYTAELATMLPKAGGPYVYARRAYGDYVGFVVGWSGWIGDMVSLAFIPIAFGEFATKLFGLNSSASVPIFAISILLLLTILKWIGLRAGSGTQKLISFLKALGVLAFVAVCFALGGQPHSTNADQTTLSPPASPFALFTALVMSFQLLLGAYGGWYSVIFFAEEDQDPSRNIPRSLHGGVLTVMVIYLLVNIALLYVLPLPQLAASKLPAADAMNLIFGASGGQIVTALALLSVAGIINACVMFIPRTLYGLGRDGLFTTRALKVNKGGTPVFALAVTVAVAVLLIPIGSFEKLMAIYTFFFVSNNILLIGSLFVLRKREPDLPRPFKTWAYPFAPLVLLLISVALFVGYVISDTTNSLYAVTMLVASYPIYLLMKKKEKASANG
jgi:APA family basic amino acid/polyamine antiporter